MVAEGAIHVKVLRGSYPNFDLVLGSGVCDDLPVVDPRGEAIIPNNCSKDISLFLKENLSVVLADNNTSSKFPSVPRNGFYFGIGDGFHLHLFWAQGIDNFVHFRNVIEVFRNF